VTQRLLACGLFAREDSLNVPRLFELYFLYSIPEGDRIDPESFLVNRLYNAATSSAHKIAIGGPIIPIARLVGVEPNPNDRVVGSERLNLTAFEQMKFYTADNGHICWIYLGNWLIHHPNVDRSSLLNRTNIYFLAGDEELARPAPPPASTHPRASGSSQPSSSHDYPKFTCYPLAN